MAKFSVLQTVTGATGPSWKQLAQWANTRSINSVELVAKKQRDGSVHIEVRGWKGLRDDTDESGVKSNSSMAVEGSDYVCRCDDPSEEGDDDFA